MSLRNPPEEIKLPTVRGELAELDYKAAITKIILAYCQRKGIDPRDAITINQHNGFIWMDLVSSGILREDMTRRKFAQQLADRVWNYHMTCLGKANYQKKLPEGPKRIEDQESFKK